MDHGQRTWPGTLAMGHGPVPWPWANGHGLWPLAEALGHGGAWHMAMASAHGQKPWPMAIAIIGQKAMAIAVAMAVGNGQGTMALGRGHGSWPRAYGRWPWPRRDMAHHSQCSWQLTMACGHGGNLPKGRGHGRGQGHGRCPKGMTNGHCHGPKRHCHHP